MKKKLSVFFGLLALSAIVLFVVLPYYTKQEEKKIYAFTMDSADGKVSLGDFEGKMPIIYFGYMYCPDICPTTLSMVASALKSLPAEDAAKFQLIFISVDPERDEVGELKEYAQYFYPNAIGITSSPEYLKQIGPRYGAYWSKEPLENSAIGYSVAHTSFVYFMDKDGILKNKVSHVQSPEPVLEVLKEML